MRSKEFFNEVNNKLSRKFAYGLILIYLQIKDPNVDFR